MADVILNPLASGAALQKVFYDQAALNGLIISLDLGGATSGAASFSTSAGGSSAAALSSTMDVLETKTNLDNSFSLGGVQFSRGNVGYVVKSDGTVQANPSPSTGVGTTVGTMTPAAGKLQLTAWAAGSACAISNWRAVAAAPINGTDSPFQTYSVTFRVATAPLRPGSFSVSGTMVDGTTFNLTADTDGVINGTRVKGKINYNTGVVRLVGVSPAGSGGQTLADVSFLEITGLSTAYVDLIQNETLRYNAVAYTYLPLDADTLGIDPVRLPSDGRVPIFKPGYAAVIGNTQTTTPAAASNGGTVNCGRTRLSRVRVIGSNGATINTGYTVDLEAGIVTWVDVTGYSQPVKVEHRIEDMAQIKSADLDGTLTLLRALTHVFPAGSFVSSAIITGDMHARVTNVFDQATWSPQTFTGALVGNAATATYNNISFPITTKNNGAVSERWAALFKTTQTVDIIGEHMGVIASAVSINADIAPVNPLTGKPYFTIPAAGWGAGWAAGNVVFFQTVAAVAPVWIARTIKQAAAAGVDYSFTLLARGDIDNPL